jgi:DNA-binding NarL/FixJ family response regulator
MVELGSKTRVAVFDGQVAVREMIGQVLCRDGSYEVVAESASGIEGLRQWRELRPSLVILDLILQEMGGVEVLRTLRAESRETRVIVFSSTLHRELTLEALQAQPHGFVHKQDSLATLREALVAVSKGCSYFTPMATEIWRNGGDAGGKGNLSERERTVLKMVAEGFSSKEVAHCLSLSAKTVEYYRTTLMQKLKLRDITALTRYAVKCGLVAVE